ncbi:MAG: MATE family efflux transporter, partial [Ruthenibacterium lactatiformans]
YFWLSALSYPMLALYNAGAALFRSMGNSRISLFASLIMNVINIGGNALLIYGLNWGVAGAATATLASRTVAGLMMMLLLRNRDNPIFLERLFHPEWNGGILKSILRVGVPNGLENGMFQIGKLLVAGLITTFGTSAIAANAICNNVGSMSNIPGSAIGLAMITVVGQCVGAKDYQQARHYTKTLLAAAYVSMGLLNIALFLLAPYLVGFYAMPQTTTDLALSVLQVNCVVTVLIWPSSFTLPNALRAAGDARFTMVTSMVSMWVFRIGMSYVLGAWLGMGLFGVWTAMQIDWAVRSLVFGVRFLGHKWEKARVLEG